MLTHMSTSANLELEREAKNMHNMAYFLDNMVPITQFNRGQAGRIFSEVKAGSPKIVIKNNEPEAIIISPEEYRAIQEKLEDLELIKMVLERSPIDPEKGIPAEEIRKKYGITEDDLEGWEDIELE